ncbi:hypothetical protein FJZ28_00520 [Candidatus Peregrinibacteria bacterium]|nr:hypothetical protein [Candidatus Peregrinibacteria bacterium]
MLSGFQSFAEPWLLFVSQDPALRMLQLYMLAIGVAMIFLVFYVTRDILLRTHSFFHMFVSILLTAGLPVVGFFVYLLIRPPRTLKEREMEQMLNEALAAIRVSKQREPGERKSGIVNRKKRKQNSQDEDIEL